MFSGVGLVVTLGSAIYKFAKNRWELKEYYGIWWNELVEYSVKDVIRPKSKIVLDIYQLLANIPEKSSNASNMVISDGTNYGPENSSDDTPSVGTACWTAFFRAIGLNTKHARSIGVLRPLKPTDHVHAFVGRLCAESDLKTIVGLAVAFGGSAEVSRGVIENCRPIFLQTHLGLCSLVFVPDAQGYLMHFDPLEGSATKDTKGNPMQNVIHLIQHTAQDLGYDTVAQLQRVKPFIENTHTNTGGVETHWITDLENCLEIKKLPGLDSSIISMLKTMQSIEDMGKSIMFLTKEQIGYISDAIHNHCPIMYYDNMVRLSTAALQAVIGTVQRNGKKMDCEDCSRILSWGENRMRAWIMEVDDESSEQCRYLLREISFMLQNHECQQDWSHAHSAVKLAAMAIAYGRIIPRWLFFRHTGFNRPVYISGSMDNSLC